MGVALLTIPAPSQSEVEIAWATYRALILAEADDPQLQNDLSHQNAIRASRARFHRVYGDWVRS